MTLHATNNQKTPQKQILSLPVGNPRLTVEQHRSIQLLIAGRTINETAAIIGKSRDTVSRWKNENPYYVAEFNRRQDEMLQASYNRLQSMTDKAIDVIEQHLAKGNLRAATELMKVVNITGQKPKASIETDPEVIIAGLAETMVRDELRKAPFASKLLDSAKRQASTELACDIAEVLRSRYGVQSPLIEFLEDESNES